MAKFIPERTKLEMEAGREALKRYQQNAPVQEPTVTITVDSPANPPVQEDMFEMPTTEQSEKLSAVFTEIGTLDEADNALDDIDVSSVL